MELANKRKGVQQLIAERKREELDSSESLSSLVARTSVDKVAAWFAASPPEKREMLTGRVLNGLIILSTKTSRHYLFPARQTGKLLPELQAILLEAQELVEDGLKGDTVEASLQADARLEQGLKRKFRALSVASIIPPDLLAFSPFPIPPVFYDLRPRES